MKPRPWLALTGIVLILLVSGCAYRYYLGMHGPSIRQYPQIHAGFKTDAECLECHHPGRDPSGPATSHPQFTGCLKCHDDPL